MLDGWACLRENQATLLGRGSSWLGVAEILWGQDRGRLSLNGSCQKLRGAWALPETLPPGFLLYPRGPVLPALHPGRSTHRLCQGLRLEGRCQQRPPRVTQPGPWRGEPGDAFLLSAGKLSLREDRCWPGEQTAPMETPRVGNIWLLSRSHPRSLFHAAVVSLTPQLLSEPTGGCLWLFSWHHLPSIYVKHPHLLARPGWLLP